MLAWHVRRHLREIMQLLRNGRCNPVVISVMLTEAYVRDSLHRLFELAAWPALYLFWPARLHCLSVGISQVQIRHWISLGFLKSHIPSLPSVLTVLNLESNYDVCEAYLKQALGSSYWEASRVAAVYCGRPQRYYTVVLTEMQKLVTEIALDQIGASGTSMLGKLADGKESTSHLEDKKSPI